MENNAQQNKTWLLDKLCASLFSQVSTEEVYQPVSEEEFQNLTPGLPEIGIVMIGLFCVENFEETPGFTLLYVLERRGYSNFVILQRALPGKEATSIAGLFPSACWFEREIQDGFGIEFRHSFDKRRLFLHEAYPYDFHPMLKSFQNRDITPIRQEVVRKINYIFKEVKGEGIYQIPVGPVHAGIIEPGHFRFSVIGETIMNLELRMFYKHRGIEKLAEGKTPAECLSLAESISGDESMANAVAFCAAIEKIAIVHISQRAWYLRTIFLEMERIYSHLGDLAGMLVDIAFPVGASDFFILREEVLRYNSILTGSRFLKNTVCPGGLRKNIPSKSLLPLDSYFNDFRDKLKQAVDYIHRSSSVIDRLETTGVIRKELINPLNITGPAARASGADLDTRLDHPYGLYPLPEEVKRTA